ncbi:MAG: hypothetical protein Q8O83_02470 [bacterium]|nr:hypothetical protein [bacterium]
MAQESKGFNTPFKNTLKGVTGRDASESVPEVPKEETREVKKHSPASTLPGKKRTISKKTRNKEIGSSEQEQKVVQAYEEKEDFALLELFSKSFDSKKSREESRQEFEEECKKADMSVAARVSLYIKMFDVAEQMKKKIEETENIGQLDPKYQSLIQEDLSRLPEFRSRLEQAEKAKEYARTHPYLKEEVQARLLFHEKTARIVSDLAGAKGLGRRAYEDSLIGVMEKFAGVREGGSQLTAFPAHNDDALMIRIGGKKYIPSGFTQEDKVLSELWNKLHAYYRSIISMRVGELMPEFERIKAYFFECDENKDAVYLVGSKDAPDEVDFVPAKAFITPREFAEMMVGDRPLSGDGYVAVLLDIVAERHMQGGKKEEFHYGKMLVIADRVADGKMETIVQGVMKHDDDYYFKQDIIAAEKIYARKRKDGSRFVYEWDTDMPTYTITPNGDLSVISHRVVRSSFEHVIAGYEREKTQVAKEKARKQRTKAFYEKLEAFSSLGDVEQPIPFAELLRGTPGTWVFDRPNWEGKRVRGYLHIREGRVAVYESVSGTNYDDREKLSITFFSSPGKEMPLGGLLSNSGFKAFARDNLLEQKLQKLFREKKFNVQDITVLFPDTNALPSENASFSVFGFESGKKVEYVFVYNSHEKSIRWVKANDAFAYRMAERVLAMEKGKGYDISDLPVPTRYFLRKAWVKRTGREINEAPIYFQPPGLAEKMMMSSEQAPETRTEETEEIHTVPETTVPIVTETPVVSSRISKILSAAGVSIEKAREMSDNELLDIEGLGKKALEEIRKT